MNISAKMLLPVLCLGCLLLVGESTLAIRLYPNLRRNQRVYHLPSTSVRHPLFYPRMSSNHIPQSDAPVSFHNNLPNSLPPLRSSNFNIQRIPFADNHLPEFSIGTANYANQRNNKMAPSYYRNGNHHHITIPVSRNSVTRITVPLVNVQQPSTTRHNLYSSHTTALRPPHTLNRNFQNHASTIAHQHPYHSSVMPPSAKKHHLLVHVGTKQRPSIQQHHVTSPNLAYHGRTLNNNYYTPSARNGLHVNSNRAVSTRTNTHSQSWRLLSPHPQVSTFVPSNQMHHPVIVAPTQQSKTYNDWRNSLGTSAFQRKPQRNHNSRHYLNVNLKNPSRNNHHQSKKSGSNNFPNMVTTSVSTPSTKLNERKLATVHIYLRQPQKHFQNSTVGTTPPPKVMAVPSNCIRCPSNQLLVIEKGKSCATVTVPPIKLCGWLSKRPGKLEMELGVGPRPGKSVKEGNYIMQFHLFKGGAKVQTCQFRINVKALRCPLIHPSENGAMQCTNNALWGSTCNFSCKSEYTLVGKPSTTCDGDKTTVFWSNPPPVCKALQCPQIHSPENSVMNCTNNTLHGSICNFKCSFGYTLEGEPATTCDGDKATLSWSTPPPVCKEKIAAFNNFGCQAPDNPNNGGVYCEPNKVNGTYSVGSACYFMCDSGYIIPSHLIQYGYIICLGSEWNITHNVECHPTHCEPPDEPENGFAQCIQAQPQGWTERGDTLSTNFLNGTKCQYKCDDGYAIPTSQLNIIHTKCIAPFWNNSAVPQCLASHCSPLSAIQNGLIKCTFDEPNSYAISSECYYDCQSGYVIPTSMQEINGRICLPSAKWNVTQIPTCKKRIVPKPEENACHDIEIQTTNASSEVLSKPSFLTADGKAAEVTCTFLNVSYEGTYENTCKATDPELQTTASCRYKITVKDVGDSYTASSLKGHECGALKAPTNGKIRCQSEGSKFRCFIQCNKGFSLPSSFTKLNNNFVECDRNDGHWDFQKEGETDLPDCLAESLTTTLQVPLKFLVVVNNCSDYIGLNNIMGAIQHSLLSRIKEECDEVDCSDFSHICGEDNITNESVLETTHRLKATYNATEHENNEEISEAEANINKLMEIIKRIVTSDAGFKKEISNAGGNLRQDSFYFDIFKLACPETGYVIDPDTLKCFECPRGTFEEDGKCKPCPGNHYQDITGRTYCKPCPHGTISKEGSRSNSDCQEQEHDLILPEANREQALTESTVFTNCDSLPCRNGGTCNIMLNSFTCICKDGYTGKQCESIICPENYCLNEGKCTSFSNNVVGCSCPKFFSGSRCEVYTEPEFCSSNPCKNNGTCILEDDSYKCHCHSDYMGEHCQIELCNKRFKQWYCLNGGICSKVLDSPICLCREEYTGVRCQHKKDNAPPS